MRPDGLRLFELLRIDRQAGTIHLKDRRLLVFDAEILGLLRKELVESLGLEQARRILTRLGFAHGYRDALTLKELFPWRSDKDWFRAGPCMHSLKGVVGAHLVHCRIERGRGIFEAETEWRNSFGAEQLCQHLGRSAGPCCWVLAGYATALFGSPAFFIERSCVACGNEHCRVVGRADGQMDDDMRRQVDYYRGEDFDATMRRLLAAAREESIIAADGRGVGPRTLAVLGEGLATTSHPRLIAASLSGGRIMSLGGTPAPRGEVTNVPTPPSSLSPLAVASAR